MKRTRYYYDFLEYYKRAEYLQQRNLYYRAGGEEEVEGCGDPLQDNVHIYNNVLRKFAGFSHVLEDIHGRRPDRWKFEGQKCDVTMRYLELIHRVTGSGASFEKDHGYRNTCVRDLHASHSHWTSVANWFEEHGMLDKRPTIFTSLGNQIPPFPKPVSGFTSGGWLYLARYAPYLANDYYEFLLSHSSSIQHRKAVDFCLDWHTKFGLKKFHFVLTAWVMDTQEYAPHLVDPWSITNYGKNAYECIDLMYENDTRQRQQLFYDECVSDVCSVFNAKPYDMEDVLCDAIRYWENFIPKNDYDHIDRREVFNNSSIKDHKKGRQAWMLGTDQWVW
jgi:hypothetical protein